MPPPPVLLALVAVAVGAPGSATTTAPPPGPRARPPSQELSILTERLSRINEDLARKMQGGGARRGTFIASFATGNPLG